MRKIYSSIRTILKICIYKKHNKFQRRHNNLQDPDSLCISYLYKAYYICMSILLFKNFLYSFSFFIPSLYIFSNPCDSFRDFSICICLYRISVTFSVCKRKSLQPTIQCRAWRCLSVPWPVGTTIQLSSWPTVTCQEMHPYTAACMRDID